MPDNITLRLATTPDDAQILLDLITRLAVYEHLTPPDQTARERFIRDGFQTNPPRFWAFLASVGDDSPVAYALFFETYSTFLAMPTLYLEDLFVVPEARKSGIGIAIMRALVDEAQRRGCGRMEWTCLDWNKLAQNFYAKIGAKHKSEWYFYRMDQNAMQRFLQSD